MASKFFEKRALFFSLAVFTFFIMIVGGSIPFLSGPKARIASFVVATSAAMEVVFTFFLRRKEKSFIWEMGFWSTMALFYLIYAMYFQVV
jgi:hypothetical protein